MLLPRDTWREIHARTSRTISHKAVPGLHRHHHRHPHLDVITLDLLPRLRATHSSFKNSIPVFTTTRYRPLKIVLRHRVSHTKFRENAELSYAELSLYLILYRMSNYNQWNQMSWKLNKIRYFSFHDILSLWRGRRRKERTLIWLK